MIHLLRTANIKLLKGVALLRLDLNTEGSWRLEAALPTVQFLLHVADRILIVSHKGRPKSFEKNLSLAPQAKMLERFLRHRVVFISHFRFGEIGKIIKSSPRGSVFLLENLRFMKGEEANDSAFARNLASLGDYYVNEAFAVSNRANASVVAITRFLRSYAGLGLEKEIENLSLVMTSPKQPLVVVLGGAKAGDKLGILKFFRKRAKWLLLGGGPANTLLAIKGVNIKDSIAERKHLSDFKPLLSYRNLIIPVDFVFSVRKILDVGPKTAKMFKDKIAKARTIIWNGPLGLIEKPKFVEGTLTVVRAIVKNRHAFSLTGGGETVTFLKKYKLDKKFSFVSTGGGAMLEFLAGKKLPGIEALKRS